MATAAEQVVSTVWNKEGTVIGFRGGQQEKRRLTQQQSSLECDECIARRVTEAFLYRLHAEAAIRFRIGSHLIVSAFVSISGGGRIGETPFAAAGVAEKEFFNLIGFTSTVKAMVKKREFLSQSILSMFGDRGRILSIGFNSNPQGNSEHPGFVKFITVNMYDTCRQLYTFGIIEGVDSLSAKWPTLGCDVTAKMATAFELHDGS
ncbi:hypothetical protein EYF80_019145 [Liparis tanakae]|uniref:Uncharacterized protein n=1 Tax=Liparis tanakae TaxID=230148 RepID=A0A4Z2HYB3_9TELE|nr:hypothetical protein EYF80_019145 [Liparis tanakae]